MLIRILFTDGGFGHVQHHTRCREIKTLRVQAAPPYDRTLTIEGNVRRAAGSFEVFCRSTRCGDDAFVIEIADARYGEYESHLAIAVLLALRQLSDLDPAATHSTGGRVGQPIWNFKFARTALAVAAFAPCLAPADPGDTFGLASSFLLFRRAVSPVAEAVAVALSAWGDRDSQVSAPLRLTPVAAAFPQARAAA